MEWLQAPELQGIAAIVAILEFILMLLQGVKPSNPSTGGGTANPSVAERMKGFVFFLLLGWITYSIPWVIIAFGMGFSLWIVFNPIFFVLGSFPPLGSIVTKSVFLGGFLGGSLSLGSLALYWSTFNSQMSAVAPPFAYFVVFAVIGGCFGALTGPTTVKLAKSLKLPLPLQ